MSNWFKVLKESRQITDTKTNVNLITEPITMDNEDKCCESAKQAFITEFDLPNKNFIWDPDDKWKEYYLLPEYFEKMECEQFKNAIQWDLRRARSLRANTSQNLEHDKWVKFDHAIRTIDYILDEWEECEHDGMWVE